MKNSNDIQNSKILDKDAIRKEILNFDPCRFEILQDKTRNHKINIIYLINVWVLNNFQFCFDNQTY